MPDSKEPAIKKPFNKKKFFIWLFVVIFLLLSVLLIFFMTLPSLISSQTAKGMIETKLTEALNRPVKIGDLKWSWTKGVVLRNVHLPNDPAFSSDPLLFLKDFDLRIYPWEFFDHKLHVDLFINGLDVNVIRNKSGQSNLDTLMVQKQSEKPETKPEKKASQPETSPPEIRIPKLTFNLPFDIISRIYLDNISFHLDDQNSDQHLLVHTKQLHLDMNSFFSQPVTLFMAVDAKVNQLNLPESTLKISVKNGTTLKNTFDLTKTDINCNARLPGVLLDVEGKLSDPGVNTHIDIDLPLVLKVAKPLLKGAVADSDVNGTIALKASARMITPDRIGFETRVKADQINVSGPVIQNKQLNPADMSVQTSGVYDLKASVLDFKQGSLGLLNNTGLDWSADIAGIGKKDIDLNVLVNSLSVDVGELFSYARDFIPPDLPVQFLEKDKSPLIHADQIAFKGLITKGMGVGTLDHLKVNVPVFKFLSNPNKVDIDNIQFNIDHLRAEISDFFPTMADLSLSAKIDKTIVNAGQQEMMIDRLDLPKLDVKVDRIAKNQNAMFGLTSQINLNQSLSMAQISIPAKILVNDFNQDLAVTCDLAPDKQIHVALSRFSVNLPNVRVEDPKVGPLELNVDLGLNIPQIRLYDTPDQIDVTDAKLHVGLGNFIDFSTTASVRKLAAESLDTQGKLKVDFSQLNHYLPPNIPVKGKMDGVGHLMWEFRGKLPDNEQLEILKSLANKPFSVDTLENALAFIEHVLVAASLDKTRFDLKLESNQKTVAGQIQAEPLLQYRYDKGQKSGYLDSHLEVSNLDLKSMAGDMFDSSMSISSDVRAQHKDFKTITMTQDARIKPFGLHTHINASVAGLDYLMAVQDKTASPQWLTRLGSKVSCQVQLADLTQLNRFKKDLSAQGKLNAGFEFNLVPNADLFARTFVDLSHVDIQMDPMIRVKALDGSLDLQKRYRIESTMADNPVASAKSPDYLSMTVLSAGLSADQAYTQSPLATTDNGFPEQYKPEHIVSFNQISSTAGPIPVSVGPFLAQLLLDQGLPNLKRFDLECLGGSLIGSFSVQKDTELFWIETSVAFSNIDTSKLAKDKSRDKDPIDARISGRLHMAVPLVTQMGPLMDKIRIKVIFTHIGSRMLERILYALDPYENNENIVSQRKLLKIGSPKWIDLEIENGNLSLHGEIDVKSALFPLKGLDRINIYNLKGSSKLTAIERNLHSLGRLTDLLNMVYADIIEIDSQGKNIQFEASSEKQATP